MRLSEPLFENRAPSAFITINSPATSNSYIHSSTNIIEESLKRVQSAGDDLETVKDIIPEVQITVDGLKIKNPSKNIINVLSEFRTKMIEQLNNLIKAYKSINQDDIDLLYVHGVPLTQFHIQNLVILGDHQRSMEIAKLASHYAYLKSIEFYSNAINWLNRANEHPGIEAGYKTYIQSRIEYLKNQVECLEKMKNRVEDYAGIIRTLNNEADDERLKTIYELSNEQ